MEVEYIIRDSQYANIHSFIVKSETMKNKGQLF